MTILRFSDKRNEGLGPAFAGDFWYEALTVCIRFSTLVDRFECSPVLFEDTVRRIINVLHHSATFPRAWQAVRTGVLGPTKTLAFKVARNEMAAHYKITEETSDGAGSIVRIYASE